jgi:hypothetical protein
VVDTIKQAMGSFFLTGKCVAGVEHFEIPKQVIKILENDGI